MDDSSASTLFVQATVAPIHRSVHVLCVGVASVDTISLLSQYPKPDEKIRSNQTLFQIGGGNAANTAVAMKMILSLFFCHYNNENKFRPKANVNFHTNVDLVSAIGNDSNGQYLLQDLCQYNIGTQHIVQYNGTSPWTFIMVYSSTRTCIHTPGKVIHDNHPHPKDRHDTHTATRQATPEILLFQHIQQENSLVKSLLSSHHYQSVHFDTRYSQTAIYIAQLCQIYHIPYSVDVEKPNREGLDELLLGSSIVLCNSTYCEQVEQLQRDKKQDGNDENEIIEEHNLEAETGGNMDKIDDDWRIVQRLKRVFQKKAPNAQIAVTTLGHRGSCLVVLSENTRKTDCPNSSIKEECNESLLQQKDRTLASAMRIAITKKYGAIFCSACTDIHDVIDTTGAGDVFQGAFLAAIWSCMSIVQLNSKNSSTTIGTVMSGSPCIDDKKTIPTDDTVLAICLLLATRVAASKIEGLGSRDGLSNCCTDDLLRQAMEHLYEYAATLK